MNATLARRQASIQVRSWPTVEQLLALGFVKCATETCRTVLDPANVRSSYCQACTRGNRDRRRADRFQHRARVRN